MAPALILPYEWISVHHNIQRQSKIILSGMLSFHGEKVSRVGLKLSMTQLFFVAINLNKLGFRVREVTISGTKLGPIPSDFKSLHETKG